MRLTTCLRILGLPEAKDIVDCYLWVILLYLCHILAAASWCSCSAAITLRAWGPCSIHLLAYTLTALKQQLHQVQHAYGVGSPIVNVAKEHMSVGVERQLGRLANWAPGQESVRVPSEQVGVVLLQRAAQRPTQEDAIEAPATVPLPDSVLAH